MLVKELILAGIPHGIGERANRRNRDRNDISGLQGKGIGGDNASARHQKTSRRKTGGPKEIVHQVLQSFFHFAQPGLVLHHHLKEPFLKHQ